MGLSSSSGVDLLSQVSQDQGWEMLPCHIPMFYLLLCHQLTSGLMVQVGYVLLHFEIAEHHSYNYIIIYLPSPEGYLGLFCYILCYDS